jgi:hypothetical protein
MVDSAQLHDLDLDLLVDNGVLVDHGEHRTLSRTHVSDTLLQQDGGPHGAHRSTRHHRHHTD